MVALKVVIFGGSGFVGTNLYGHLHAFRDRDGRKQYDVARPRRNQVDLTSYDQTADYLFDNHPDIVVHLAARVGGIVYNKDHPAEMIDANLTMGQNVINACRLAQVKKIVYLGTVCSYPHTPPNIPFLEDDLWNGRPEPTNEPYGLAKKTIGMMLDACYRQHGQRSAYLLPTNMYGPHDNFNLYSSHVIPAMLRKFIEAGGEPVTLWGDGSPSREFLYVGDCCEAIRLAIERIERPQPINVGTGVETPIRYLADTVAGLVGYRGGVIWDSRKPNGQPRRCLDTTRAESLLGFRASTGLQDGLHQTLAWYRESQR